ncbi:MAG: MraY family glycosyltransferase [Planctomycetota bacterium]
MNTLTATLLPLACLLVSTGLTGLLRRYALHRGMMDHPNERSSHSIPTPRGGGLAITLTFLTSVLLLFLFERLPQPLFVSLFVGGGLIAGVGFWDDHSSLSAPVRLLFHTGAAVLCLHQLDLYSIYLEYTGSSTMSLGIALFALISMVWLINLYNFMDGIDGLAGLQALLASGFGAALAMTTRNPELAMVFLALGGASLGFLLWNWHPAKIFMGDVGSGFLGYTFALLIFAPTWGLAQSPVRPLAMFHGLPPLSWALLCTLFLFVADATMTLLRRMFRGERWWAPHRSHAYQHASVRFGHLRVTLFYGAITLCLLYPMAYWICTAPKESIRYLPLPFIALCLTALGCRGGIAPKD